MEVKRTGYGHNVSKTLGYVGGKHSPAHTNKNGIKHRNLAVAGIGVRANTLHNTRRDFARIERMNPYKIKSVNYVISPKKGTVDPHNQLEVQSFLDYAIQVTREAFPNHKAYLGVQADNKNMITHCHVVVAYTDNSIQHHHLTGKTEDYHYLRKVARHVLKEPRFANDPYLHIDMPTSEKRSPNTKPSYNQKAILDRIQPILDQVDTGEIQTMNQFREACKSSQIIAKPRKVRRLKRDKNGNIMYRRYKNGRYRKRKNRRGRRVREPIYTYKTGGLTFRFAPSKKKKHRKYEKISAYHLSRYDKRCSLKYIQHTMIANQLERARHDQLERETGSSSQANKILAIRQDLTKVPTSLKQLEALYPNPLDKAEIYQMIPSEYHRDNQKRHHQLNQSIKLFHAPLTDLGHLTDKVIKYTTHYKAHLEHTMRVIKKHIKGTYIDFKDSLKDTTNQGFHEIMKRAKQYIPDYFKKNNNNSEYIHLSPGTTVITKKYDSEAKEARKRIKLNGGLTSKTSRTPNRTIMRKLLKDEKKGKQQAKILNQKQRQDNIRTKRHLQKIRQQNTKYNRELQNQNRPIHRGGPQIGDF